MPEHRTFQCVVIAPQGRILDCRATSVIFPAHDGQVGIMYNHMPMFCKLGLDIMKVMLCPSDQEPLAEDIFLLIDGGFAMIGPDMVELIVYDAVSFKDTKVGKIERMIEDIKKTVVTGRYSVQQSQRNTKKISLLTRFVQMSKPAK